MKEDNFDIENMLENDDIQEFSNNSSANKQTTSKKSNLKILIVFLGIFVALFCVMLSLGARQSFDKASTENQTNDLVNNTMDEVRQQMGDDFYKAATNGADIPQQESQAPAPEPTPAAPAPTVPEVNNQIPPPELPAASKPAQQAAKQQNTDKKAQDSFVTVNLASNVGRTNPFVPTVNTSSYGNLPKVPKVNYSMYPAPPTTIIPDARATALMKTTISGIMYDAFSPSAIISVEDQDHLVRKGDRINGYKILDITKDRVIVQNGTNIYRATVGETLTTESSNVQFNTIDNLQYKFGGRNAAKGTTMIQIN